MFNPFAWLGKLFSSDSKEKRNLDYDPYYGAEKEFITKEEMEKLDKLNRDYTK